MTPDLSRLGDWRELPFFDHDLPQLWREIAEDWRETLPQPDQIFAALERCPPTATRVVILGQDPYPTPGHAHGLAFSAHKDTTPLPKSLANIFKELQNDIGTAPWDADLGFWADQGVLLLNTVLTTPAGVAGGHRKLGWERLTRQVLDRLNTGPHAFVLWGKDAQSYSAHLTHPDHLILKAPHPSPLSAYRGFFGSRPFSTVNRWLMDRQDTPINWAHRI
ncbi:MAG: uracil-DNA glycosylase [Paracoccaceae bacterium]